ncbi:MAG: hypothetical protein AABX96_03910 [Nanoarchaeota archaeon]
MKKWLFLLIIFSFLIQISMSSAIQYICSDNSSISTDSEEISEGKVESIRGLKIGVCDSYENRFQKLIESILFIDSNIITLENDTMISEIELKQSNSTIKYSNATSDSAIITLSGSTEELEIGDCSSLGGLNVKIENIEGTGSTAIIKVLVGYTKKTLNTNQNSSEIITMNSKQYGITLTGGSSDMANVKVSTCRTGDLTQVAEIINTTNSTNLNQTNITNTTEINQTQIIQNTTIKECEIIGQINSTQYCNTEGKYINQSLSGQSCTNDFECISNSCKENLCSNKSFFSKIIDWIKGIFN